MPEIGERRVRTATFVVAASNSMVQDKTMADYVCDGVNDHVEIQAALDALPAAGGMVHLSQGTFNIEVALVLDSYQTLRGVGRSTILTTTTADLDIITATGGSGTEKIGIVITDLCIDGNAGGVANDTGILLTYVDNSKIENCWIQDNGEHGIKIDYSDFNEVTGNTCNGNTQMGIFVLRSTSNKINGNTCQGNSTGIRFDTSTYNTAVGNVCKGNTGFEFYLKTSNYNTVEGNSFSQGNGHGIDLDTSKYNAIVGNISQKNAYHGISTNDSDHNTIVGNSFTENSQDTSDTYSDVHIYTSSYNLIQANTFRAGSLANVPKYGLYINGATCTKNVVIGNDLYNDGFGTAPLNDTGTLTTIEDNNRGITIDQIKMFRFMKNTSGVQRVAGDVVSLKAVAAGNEVTAPAAIGERQVYGMVAETINDTAWGLIQVKGKTIVLKGTNVGGGNIVIGDNLITENGVRARKAAAATDPIFARALEALAAADGVIDAYIVSPWD